MSSYLPAQPPFPSKYKRRIKFHHWPRSSLLCLQTIQSTLVYRSVQENSVLITEASSMYTEKSSKRVWAVHACDYMGVLYTTIETLTSWKWAVRTIFVATSYHKLNVLCKNHDLAASPSWSSPVSVARSSLQLCWTSFPCFPYRWQLSQITYNYRTVYVHWYSHIVWSKQVPSHPIISVNQ